MITKQLVNYSIVSVYLIIDRNASLHNANEFREGRNDGTEPKSDSFIPTIISHCLL